MWTCIVCKEVHEDHFEECWKCATEQVPPKLTMPLKCIRCGSPMSEMGTRFVKMETGGAFVSVFSDFTEMHQDFDLYGCSTCGKVEFFLHNVGRAARQPIADYGDVTEDA